MSEIREDIVTALVTRLGAIATGSGYRYTVDTVERGYRDPAEVPDGDRPYIGIVPASEAYVDTSGGQIETTMKVVLACYLAAAANTQAAIVTALSGFTSDVRKALYTSPQNLGVAGVIFVRLLSRQGVEGLQEAIKKKDASMLIEISVKFVESATA